jgi:hypothetical protein
VQPHYQLYARSLALQFVLRHLERVLEQLLLLFDVARLQTGSDGGARISACVHHVSAVVVFSLVEKSLDARLHETPCACIEWFLLTPDNGLGVGVRVEVVLQLRPREWVELFDTGDCNILDLVCLDIFAESNVDLTCAENDAGDVFGLVDGLAMLRVGDDPLEVGVAGECLDIRAGDRMAKERLREEHKEGWNKLAENQRSGETSNSRLRN